MNEKIRVYIPVIRELLKDVTIPVIAILWTLGTLAYMMGIFYVSVYLGKKVEGDANMIALNTMGNTLLIIINFYFGNSYKKETPKEEIKEEYKK